MKIFGLLWKNLVGGSRTMRFPDHPVVEENFRGLVCFDPELCSGCAMCKFRCTARAIEFKPGKGEFTWSYEPGQCTFCGRCVDGCKEGALSQESVCPPIYEHAGELKKSYTLARKAPVRKPQPASTAAVETSTESAGGGK